MPLFCIEVIHPLTTLQHPSPHIEAAPDSSCFRLRQFWTIDFQNNLPGIRCGISNGSQFLGWRFLRISSCCAGCCKWYHLSCRGLDEWQMTEAIAIGMDAFELIIRALCPSSRSRLAGGDTFRFTRDIRSELLDTQRHLVVLEELHIFHSKEQIFEIHINSVNHTISLKENSISRSSSKKLM